MDEAGFWSGKLRGTLVKQCQALQLRHHFERVENTVADGTPDVDYCIAGVAGKIELKWSDHHPVRDTSQVLKKDSGLRRSQIVFASRRVWAGGLVFAIIGTPVEVWCLDLRYLTPEQMAGIATASPLVLRALACWHTGRDPWDTLPGVLQGNEVRERSRT